MGDFVVKAAPDEDVYVIWNTTADGLTYAGTRDEIREYLWDDYNRQHPHSTPHPGWSPDDAMNRADTTGSSARDSSYSWKQTSFIVGAGAPGNGYELPRASLLGYVRALEAKDEAAAQALLVKSDD